MPISIFNPPCPHADPVNGISPWLPANGQGKCGNCICVPRYYLLIAGDFAPPTGYPQAFSGRHVLRRDVPTYTTNSGEPCHWDCPIAIPNLLVNLPSITPAGWSLYYTDSVHGWICRAAGQSYVGDIPPQDVAYYTLRAPGHPQAELNCLGTPRPNPTDRATTFYLDSNYGSPQSLGSLPGSVIIRPFCP
jgi:hypothetical protein